MADSGIAQSTGRPRRRWLRLMLAVVLLVAIYYGAGAIWLHRIDADPAFGQGLEVPAGGAHSVALAASLLDREVNRHRWLPNDPFFMPGALLDNMPRFQEGILETLALFGTLLADELARQPDGTDPDADLAEAVERLGFPPAGWLLEGSTSPIRTSSDSHYGRAIAALARYNERLAAGDAVLARDAESLVAALERIEADLLAISTALHERIDGSAGAWLDWTVDDLFYRTKGRLHAHAVLLRGLGQDFAAALDGQEALAAWQVQQRLLERTATIQPWVVTNGGLDGWLRPNHLAHQGFMLLRARAALRMTGDILRR
jgi:hypothetical protein